MDAERPLGPGDAPRRREWPTLAGLVLAALAVALLGLIAVQGGRPPEAPLEWPCTTTEIHDRSGGAWPPGPTLPQTLHTCPVATTPG